jgi:hypothetical protein
MVDYLSVGYFRVFGLISPHSWATPREYAIFDATTSSAMTFNDHHAGCDRIDVRASSASWRRWRSPSRHDSNSKTKC